MPEKVLYNVDLRLRNKDMMEGVYREFGGEAKSMMERANE